MELLIAMALAYALGGGVMAGHEVAAKHSKTPKAPRPIDRTDTGRRIAEGAVNSVARVYTLASGAREGWRKAWPDTKAAISERRMKVRAAKEERKAAREKEKVGAGLAADDGIVDAEIVEDEVVNTGGPKAPKAEKNGTTARGKSGEAPEAAAKADATVRVHVATDPPVPPRPDYPPTARADRPPAPGGPAGGPTVMPPVQPLRPDPGGPGGGPVVMPPVEPLNPAPAAGAPPSAAEPPQYPLLRVVKDDEPARPAVGTGGGTATAPRSPMSNLPTAAALVTEVTGVESLMKYLAQLSRWARMEKDDASAAVTRLTDLRAKAEHAYNAAAAANYDQATLAELATIVEQLTELKGAREEDLRASDLAERNSGQASSNVWARHGAIQEARNQSDVDMADTSTYGD